MLCGLLEDRFKGRHAFGGSVQAHAYGEVKTSYPSAAPRFLLVEKADAGARWRQHGVFKPLAMYVPYMRARLQAPNMPFDTHSSEPNPVVASCLSCADGFGASLDEFWTPQVLAWRERDTRSPRSH